MLGLPADTLTRQGVQSGQITCYEKRTDHVLSTRRFAVPLPWLTGSPSLSPADFIGGKGRLMPRGPKPAKSKEGKPPVTRKSSKNEDARVRDLKKSLAEALNREAEALE